MKKLLLIMVVSICLSGCVASSKHVKRLDKIVEAQAKQMGLITDILIDKGIVVGDPALILKKNSTDIIDASKKQVEESASIFSWKIFSWAGFLLVVGKIVNLAGSVSVGGWVGTALSGVAIAGTWLLKNKQKITALTENNDFHTKDKEKIVATILTPKDSTETYDKNKVIAKTIVADHNKVKV